MMSWLPLLPWIFLAGTALALILAITVRRHYGTVFTLALIGLGASFAALFPAASAAPARVSVLLLVDRFALFFFGLILAAGIAVVLSSGRYVRRSTERGEEYYVLVVLALLGAGILVASTHFVSFFLGLELLSVSLYALIAYVRERICGVEAGVKYLILAGVSSAFLLFGMALVYARVGSLAFERIAYLLAPSSLTPASPATDLIVLAGLGLMLVGVGFKLGVVPFHMWTPDVYQGAPAPVTALTATVSKGAVMALLVRFGAVLQLTPDDLLWQILGLIAALSMIAGNLLALHQVNLKRLLAYSSIAHLGYVLVAFLAAGEAAVQAVAFYLVAYMLTTLAAFGVVSALSEEGEEDRDVEEIEEYRGLGRKRPYLSAVLTLALLSLAGIPLTAGFIGKFLVFGASIGSAMWALAVLVALNSAIGIYYYLRVVVALYLRGEESGARGGLASSGGAGGPPGSMAPESIVPGAAATAVPVTPDPTARLRRIFVPAGIALALLALLLVLLGVAPQVVLRMIVAPG